MENQKAIEILKEMKRQSEVILENPTTFYSEKHIVVGCETMRKHIEAYDTAIAALEKQIPTEPIRKSWELPRCPSCDAPLGEWIGDGYTKDWESKTVCDCGQKIDWSN